MCVGELRYVGQAELLRDLDNFTAALAGTNVAGAFLPANTPGTIEHWMANEHYENDEAFLFGIAEAMREEYNAIVDAGFLQQIDDPDLPDGWACLPDITVPDYRKYATLRIDALNHALSDIPKEKVRLHVCWGSFHGPHHDDIPLRDIIDLIFRVRAGSYSIEASNPCHEHEWRVFEQVKLPDGATLVPGVVGHCQVRGAGRRRAPRNQGPMGPASASRMMVARLATWPLPVVGLAPTDSVWRSCSAGVHQRRHQPAHFS